VQFEEKKFLEAARKIIQDSVQKAGQRIESENMGNF
jgi:hypothetical protein